MENALVEEIALKVRFLESVYTLLDDRHMIMVNSYGQLK